MLRILTSFIIFLLLFIIIKPSLACTLWAANGDYVAGGGSLIAKSRDFKPNRQQIIDWGRLPGKHRYFGIFTLEKIPRLVAGINDNGLVVVSATAGSIDSKSRAKMPQSKWLLEKLLAECDNVDEALSLSELFFGPRIDMLADNTKVATIEIGPNHIFATAQQQNYYIYHTNHYILKEMSQFNEEISKSSQTRYDRIGFLLKDSPYPFTLSEFIGFSNDQHDGPDNSIFRIGSTPSKTRTLSTWIVYIPTNGSPQVYIRLLNPGEFEQTLQYDCADVFNGTVNL